MKRKMLRVVATGGWIGMDQKGVREKSAAYEGPFEVDIKKDGTIVQVAKKGEPGVDLSDLTDGAEGEAGDKNG